MKICVNRVLTHWKGWGHLTFQCALAFLLLFALSARGAEPQVLRGHVPAVVAKLAPAGSLPAAQHLNLAIGLPLRNTEALTNLLHELYDPASPNYHQFLTPQQFTQKFGPSEADYQAVIAFATAHGLEITTKHPNRAVLSVRGGVAEIAKALHLTLRLYQHPTEARKFYSPDVEPSLDLTVPVLHISGLSDYNLPHPMMVRKPLDLKANANPNLGSGPGGTYMGDDFRAAYVPGASLNGAGQTVGLLQFDAFYPNDITAYENLTGRPNVPITVVPVDGGVATPGGGDPEVSLDLEMVISMAPGISGIYVYEAPNPSPWVDLLSRMANDNLSKQLSCSWGGGPPDPAGDQIFLQMAAQGQSFFNACGDSDAFVGAIPFPAESPYIMEVGGTTLSTTGPGGAWQSEKVWNWGGGVGTCGGISTTYSIPTWQQGIDMTLNQGSTTMRNIPDVALTADNVYVIYGNGQSGSFGGTSCAAPLWAGFTSLINQQAAFSGQPSVGFLNPALYAIGKGLSYTNSFHDTTTGNNTWSGSPNLFFAVPGYDLCTGWGTPTGTNLINALASPIPKPSLIVISNFLFGGNGNGIIDFDECNSLNLTLGNVGGATATGIRATLSTTTPEVAIAQATAAYPDLGVNASAVNPVPFGISTSPSFACGTPINFSLLLQCDQAVTEVQFSLPTGSPGSPLRFDNSTPAPIPDLGETNSIIVVSNLNAVLSKVTVALYITHTYDSDLLIQLISPDNTTNTLSANNGFSGQNYGAACSPDALRTTFDDAAANSIVSGTAPFVGTFQPQTPLSVFSGKVGASVNGNWRLRIVDQVSQNVGTLQCWSLFLSPAQCHDGGGECPGADLALGMTAQPNPVIAGNNLTYSITVTNNGPSTPTNVIVTHSFPPSMVFVSAASSQGAYSQSGGGVVLFNLGRMGPRATATMTVVTAPTTAGTMYSTATVSSEQTDPNPFNNSAIVPVRVNPASVDLAVGIAAAPNSVIIGNTLTYTVSVTNNGPNVGTGVFVTDALPANAAVLSATVSQGSITTGGALWTVGTLARGAHATATIAVVPSAVGTITATATVVGNQFDPVAANNTATVSTVVGPAADLAIGIADYPNPTVVGSNVTYLVSVTNLGPSAATSVIVNDSISPDLTVLVTNASQGAVSVSGGALTWILGTLANGAKATLTIIASTSTNETLVTTATVTATEADPNLANNSATATTVVAPAGVAIAAAGASLTAESFYPPNGAIDIGETVTVILRLRNSSNVSTLNLVGTLLATNGVTPAAPTTQTYGVLAPSGFPVGRAFTFTANGTNGQTISATLQLHDGATVYPPVSFNFTLPVAQTFANTNTILIPDPAASPPYLLESGPAKPYPSIITVANLNGLLGKVTVTLSNLTHTYPRDINVLLVGPNGAKTLLMSHAGDLPVTNLNLTFDDSASGPLPESGSLGSGVWQPTAYTDVTPTPTLPTNAPAGPYAAALSAFNASSPNGAWSLYVYDDSAGDAGSISNGWSLTLSMITPVNQLADLALSAAGAPNPVLAGTPLTYTFTVANSGPNAASSVAFTNTVPAGVTLVSASPSQGTAITNGNAILANLGTLNTGAVATVTVVVVPSPSVIPPGTNTAILTSTATVGCSETDPNPANNTASAVTTVKLPLADVGVTLAVAPDPTVTGNNLTNTIVVTNYGPGTALAVVLTDPLPAGAAFVSANSTVGTCSNFSGTVTCSLGDLATNAGATISIVVVPSLAGLMTNTVSAVTGSQDTNSANNTATYVSTVTIPTPKIVSAGALLTYESGPVNGLIDPNETVTLSLSLANVGSLDTVNLKATLLATGGVTSPGGPQGYGALIHGGPSTAQSFTFKAAAVFGSAVVTTLQLQDERPGVTNSLGAVAFTFNQPSASAWSNTNFIIIPDHGIATPYPSTIAVSNLQGVVTKATVTLNGLTHTFPHDVNVVLVSPAGGNVLLMSHTGGGYSVTNLTLTFDDAAATTLPNYNMITTLTNRLSSYEGPIALPGPAPTGSYGSALAGLEGWTPNGTWTLYVFDDHVGDDGNIAGGWSLNLSTASALRPLADLAIGISSAPGSLFLGGSLTNTMWVTNFGPASATGVVVSNTLSGGQQVSTNLGSLAAGATAKVIFILVPAMVGNIISTASVSGNEVDLNPANNSAQTTTAVLMPASAFLSGSFVSGQFRLTAIAQPSFAYAFQVSTDLVTWVSLSTNTASISGALKFTDTASPGSQRRFYRTKRLSP